MSLAITENKDIILNVLNYLPVQSEQSNTIALVCKTWHEVIAHHPYWSTICLEMGIPIPSNMKEQSRFAYFYAKTSLFLRQVEARERPKIEEIDLGMDFSNTKVQFVEDRFLVAQKQQEIQIYDLNNRLVINKYTTPGNILAVCSNPFSLLLYCGLDSRKIVVIPIIPHPEKPVSCFDSNREPTRSPVACNEMHLFAINQWFGCREFLSISLTSTELQESHSSELPYDIFPQSLQIDQNRLYCTVCDGLFFYLAHADLSCADLTFERIPIRTHFSMNVNNLTCSYITDEGKQIATMNLRTRETSCWMTISKGYHRPYLREFNGLAVLVHDDPERADTITHSGLLDLIDLKNGTLLHSIPIDMIHSDPYYVERESFWNEVPITIFQGTILYLNAAHHVVKITFPQNL